MQIKSPEMLCGDYKVVFYSQKDVDGVKKWEHLCTQFSWGLFPWWKGMAGQTQATVDCRENAKAWMKN